MEDVADHFDHAVKIAGIDQVGIGSDFDGISRTANGLEDVSKMSRWLRFAETRICNQSGSAIAQSGLIGPKSASRRLLICFPKEYLLRQCARSNPVDKCEG